MTTHKDEIAAILKEHLRGFRYDLETQEVGVVAEVGDGIAHVYGLDRVMFSEITTFGDDVYGLVLNLEEESVGVALFGDTERVKEGDEVRRTGRVLETPVGEAFLGRVVDPLGRPLDGNGPIVATGKRTTDAKAPGVIDRQPVDTPLQTGLKAIDAMTPIGRGQRELIIGDRRTGKTAIALDTIINQKGKNVHCVYVAIGQKASTVARIVDTLVRHDALSYTIVVVADAHSPTPMQYLAPYAGCAMAEYFTYKGDDSFIVYDDLSKHAVAYREIALLLRRPPGREAYPGDIFYTHSRLLERAARLADRPDEREAGEDMPESENGRAVMLPREVHGGSLTAFPIIETKAGDITSYIPTNVISITDGQIYLETNLFNQGVRPAINVGYSVSRVGGAAQIRAMSQIAGELRLELSQYRELEAFAEFSSDLDEESKAQLARGDRLMQVLGQGQYQPMPVEDQVLSLYVAVKNHLADVEVPAVRRFEEEWLRYLHEKRDDLVRELREKKELTSEFCAKLETAVAEFKKRFGA
ncbi:MAG: F0F1 ATP synthase subunit alpha [Candidatus Bipolaricaulota bacterium]|nr:F0F1 ATP synthase subunit alpha [Candidatus Bipolaricaulota bacterium]